MMSLRKHFQTSLDLPGVAGAFCITNNGDLVESFMPSPYSDDVFEELGPRLVSLTEAVDMSYNQTHEMLLQFESNALYLRRNENVMIGFLTVRNPLLSGLRVSANLLLKQAKSKLDEAVHSISSNQAPSQPSAAEEDDEEDDEDPFILQSASKEKEEPKPKAKRKGLFGRKKPKRNEANDIWG